MILRLTATARTSRSETKSETLGSADHDPSRQRMCKTPNGRLSSILRRVSKNFSGIPVLKGAAKALSG